jgi:hypothetical protein
MVFHFFACLHVVPLYHPTEVCFDTRSTVRCYPDSASMKLMLAQTIPSSSEA